MSTKEERFTSAIKCNHCGNKAPMKIVATYAEVDPIKDSDGQVVDEAVDHYELIRCPACEKVVVPTKDDGTPSEVSFAIAYKPKECPYCSVPLL